MCVIGPGALTCQIAHERPFSAGSERTCYDHLMLNTSMLLSSRWPAKALAGIIAFSLGLAFTSPALAQGRDGWRMPGDQLAPSSPRDGVRSGRQVPLGEVVGQLRQRYGGEMVNADQQGDPPVYYVRWKTSDGRLVDVQVDARTGEVMR